MTIKPLTQDQFADATKLLLDLELDTREEIEHHLNDIAAHFVAVEDGNLVGVIGWYQDSVNYANAAMGEKFPGEDAYWVGFFGVRPDKQRQGIGTQLLNAMEKQLRDKGETELWVSSVPESESYYAKMGFKTVMEGEIDGSKKIFMLKHLN